MSKVLTIRADSSPTMGTGHVMRMIALGQAWQALGGTVRILGQASMLADRLAAEGFELISLAAVHPDPGDAQGLLDQTTDNGWIAIDGYHFDSGYLAQIKDSGRRTLVLDDLCDRGDYAANLLLNQNPDGPSYPYQLPTESLLLGTRYALLRNDFQRTDSPAAAPVTARKVLVTLGGADPDNVTAKVLDAMKASGETDLHVKVVAGAANPHLSELEAKTGGLPFTCELLTAVSDMPALMQWADMAVSAAGTTAWELCFFGVPFLALRIADNQKGVISELQRHGAARCLDSTTGLRDIAAEFTALLTDASARHAMREAGRRLVDGKGARRVAQTMYNADIMLRPAQAGDCEPLLAWRNAPETRANSFSTEEIPLATHKKWFDAKLEDDQCLFFVAEDEGVPVGQIRFDRENDAATVSVSVAPSAMNRGIGTVMTHLGCRELAQRWPGATAVALVKHDNPASAAMFKKAGFVQATTGQDDHLTFTWSGKYNDAR